MGYLIGETKKSTSIVILQKWKSENSMVIAWLVNSVKLAIGKTHLFLPTAKDICDSVKDTYFDVEDSSHIFEIKTRLWQTGKAQET